MSQCHIAENSVLRRDTTGERYKTTMSTAASFMSLQGSDFTTIAMQDMKHLKAVRDDTVSQDEGSSIFKDVLASTVNQVKSTQQDVENKQYLLATGQLEDAHSLPIAEAKAAVSLDLLVALRNKAMESYNDLMRMNI